jgi:hypothetical protein
MGRVILAAAFAFFVHSTIVQAGVPIKIAGSDICLGFGCDGFPIIGNDALKQRWEEIGEGPESAFRICEQVSTNTCSKLDFIQTYQALRLAAMARLFNSLDGCVAFGTTMSNFGHKGAQLIMLANGILYRTKQ